MLNRPTLVLMPGMDGTGKLFEPLLKIIPPQWPTRVISYPVDLVMGYPEVEQLVERELDGIDQLVAIAESYSGPIALGFAAAHPQRVAAVVLCASFIAPPLPRWMRCVVGPWMFWMRPPKLALRALMVGGSARDALVAEVSSAIAMVRPKVMARRIKDICELECGDALRACEAPVMYLAATRDKLVGRRSLDFILMNKPDVKVCGIDAPHLLLQAEPGKAWEMIRRFLEENGIG